ncbi:energy-coupled thiamine transporter ThiT [Clostridiaceae bacterium 14S0207]|nr:energy-coupled thiamine transporter ThiT [Clostridiaceae bacterium 14S0207]
MINIIGLIISIGLLGIYIINLIKYKFTTNMIVKIGVISSLSFVLYLIHFIRYPQGGGITLFSMLLVMILSILYGNIPGITGGLIFGLLKLLNGAVIVHPLQFLLDYILGTMALGVAGAFGKDKKYNIILGSLFATGLSLLSSVISGVLFFGQYAPKGMNVWLYSIIYNGSSAGAEAVLTTILIAIIPIKKFIK